MSNRKIDLVAGIVLAIFALWYLYQSFSIRMFAAMGKVAVNSATMPKLWAICMLLLAAALISRYFRKGKAKKAEKKAGSGSILADNAEVIATFVSLIVYVVLLKYAGFIVSTSLYVFAQTIILMQKHERNYVKAGVLAIVFSVVAYFLFVHVLAVLLPIGTWFEPLFR